ncbi:hypothetical protein D9757_003469 [Collybiopsis confluens]|uniref:HTH CENPB-type domain-containing protein n=1 Tax=Collybiopsis confluens TaxID=2823264 RepID=A0A8H5HTM6_9AGAR|nr:hypothetical protein D9757_003469 [Collybiopsis confluens]
MSYAYGGDASAEYLEGLQQSPMDGARHTREPPYPSPTPSMSPTANAPSPSAYSFPVREYSAGPHRVTTRGQRRAAATTNLDSGAPISRSQTPQSMVGYPLTPDSAPSSSAPPSSLISRQLSASPAPSSGSSQSQRSVSHRRQHYQPSMSPAPSPSSPSSYLFHLPGPQPNPFLPSTSPGPSFPLPSGSNLPRAYSKPKARKQRLFNIDRKAICEFHMAHPNEKQEVIARRYGVERSTISKILKDKEKWLSIDPLEGAAYSVNGPFMLAKHRPSKFPPVEFEMQKWLMEVSEKWNICLPEPSSEPYDPKFTPPVHGPLTDRSLRERARAIARSHGITPEQFKASSGWVENFKHRHGIRNGFWGGYLRNVQGRNSLVARTMGLTSLGSVTPPTAASKHLSSPYSYPQHQTEEDDEGDSQSDNEAVDMQSSVYHPPSVLSHVRDGSIARPPWSTDSSSTSASGVSLPTPHSSRSYHSSRPPWSSDTSIAHSPPAHRRTLSGFSMNSTDIAASQPTPNLHAVYTSIAPAAVESAVQRPRLDHHELSVQHVEHPKETIYHMFSAGEDGTSSAVAVQPFSSEYPPLDIHRSDSSEPPNRSSQIRPSVSSTGYNQGMHHHSDVSMQTVLPPPPPISDTTMPSLSECEDYLTKISFFVDEGPGQGILNSRRREWLRKLKVAFFEAGSGIPITPDSDEEGS